MVFFLTLLGFSGFLIVLARFFEQDSPRAEDMWGPTKPIGSVSAGEFATVRGHIRCDAPIESPMDGTAVVFVEHASYESTLAASALLRETEHISEGTQFVVDDGTGFIRVHGLRCEVHAPVIQGDQGYCAERRLRVGQEVIVSGTFLAEPGEGPYRGSTTFVCAEGTNVDCRTEPPLVPQVQVMPAFLRATGALIAGIALVLLTILALCF